MAALAATWCMAAAGQDSSDQGASDGVIHLHMPVRHVPHHVPPPASVPASVDAIGAEPATAPPAPALVPVEKEVSAPAPAETKSAPAASAKAPTAPHPTIPFNFGDDESSPSDTAPATPPSALKTASLPPRAAGPAHAAPEHVGAADQHLTKRGAILFDKGISDPSAAQFNGVKVLASDLATALESGASRIELEAYGGTPGDKSTDARRLSLKRALAVRQLLIDDGVPSSRIDVRAMGGIDDKGPTDRVDVFVRTG